jgi:GTP pyrophosphokinase
MKNRDDVLVQIGNLSRKPSSIIRVIDDQVIAAELGPRKILEKPTSTKKSEHPTLHAGDSVGVIIGQTRDIPYKIAKCCAPTPLDRRIVGAIGQGIVTIHRVDCTNIAKVELERRLLAKWSDDTSVDGVVFDIECTLRDKRGLLMDITTLLYHMGISIRSVTTEDLGDGLVRDHFSLEYGEDDYYIYERLEGRFRFEIGELTDIRLISMS